MEVKEKLRKMFPAKTKTTIISSEPEPEAKNGNETVTDKFKGLSPEIVTQTQDGKTFKGDDKGNKKKRVGRPEKEPEPEYKPFQIFDREDLKLAVSIIPFGLIAGLTKDNKWLLSEKEKAHLAPKVDKVVTKYMPKIAFQYVEETELALSIATKLIIHSQMESQPVDQSESKENDDGKVTENENKNPNT